MCCSTAVLTEYIVNASLYVCMQRRNKTTGDLWVCETLAYPAAAAAVGVRHNGFNSSMFHTNHPIWDGARPLHATPPSGSTSMACSVLMSLQLLLLPCHHLWLPHQEPILLPSLAILCAVGLPKRSRSRNIDWFQRVLGICTRL